MSNQYPPQYPGAPAPQYQAPQGAPAPAPQPSQGYPPPQYQAPQYQAPQGYPPPQDQAPQGYPPPQGYPQGQPQGYAPPPQYAPQPGAAPQGGGYSGGAIPLAPALLPEGRYDFLVKLHTVQTKTDEDTGRLKGQMPIFDFEVTSGAQQGRRVRQWFPFWTPGGAGKIRELARGTGTPIPMVNGAEALDPDTLDGKVVSAEVGHDKGFERLKNYKSVGGQAAPAPAPAPAQAPQGGPPPGWQPPPGYNFPQGG